MLELHNAANTKTNTASKVAYKETELNLTSSVHFCRFARILKLIKQAAVVWRRDISRHQWAECLENGISSGPYARNRVPV